mmetsp:Transcript_35622/g.100843  ORF Transcript_35622/g.100843 Transcript_35622/m.100843 type:complete len:248 (+) Transcript_35622:422-1165(+)
MLQRERTPRSPASTTVENTAGDASAAGQPLAWIRCRLHTVYFAAGRELLRAQTGRPKAGQPSSSSSSPFSCSSIVSEIPSTASSAATSSAFRILDRPGTPRSRAISRSARTVISLSAMRRSHCEAALCSSKASRSTASPSAAMGDSAVEPAGELMEPGASWAACRAPWEGSLLLLPLLAVDVPGSCWLPWGDSRSAKAGCPLASASSLCCRLRWSGHTNKAQMAATRLRESAGDASSWQRGRQYIAP